MTHDQADLYVIVLAGGRGTRMKSSLPKVLHKLAGKPMVEHIVDAVQKLSPKGVVIVTGFGKQDLHHWGESVSVELSWAFQEEQLGTAHAVSVALKKLSELGASESAKVLILSGDVPLTSVGTLESLVNSSTSFNMVTIDLENPCGYGRILRENGRVVGIVEEKDATVQQCAIKEVNTNIFCVNLGLLKEHISCVGNNNAQGEYYLPDIVQLAVQAGQSIDVIKARNPWEVQGVNSKLQLQHLERYYQLDLVRQAMLAGLTVMDESRVDIRGQLSFGTDCQLDVNVVIEGDVALGNNVYIGQNVRLKDVKIGDNVRVENFCDLDQATLENGVSVGPFARVRPGTLLGEGSKLGNFVETKNAVLDKGAKINHLSYAGDCEIGAKANIGAGTIFCNYDGVNKHKTVIGANAFIGSNSSLVAPVKVGTNSTVGAGSTITTDVPDDTLAVARARPRMIEGWERPTKK